MTARAPVPKARPLWALAVRQSAQADSSATAVGPEPGGALWREVLPRAEEGKTELSL